MAYKEPDQGDTIGIIPTGKNIFLNISDEILNLENIKIEDLIENKVIDIAAVQPFKHPQVKELLQKMVESELDVFVLEEILFVENYKVYIDKYKRSINWAIIFDSDKEYSSEEYQEFINRVEYMKKRKMSFEIQYFTTISNLTSRLKQIEYLRSLNSRIKVLFNILEDDEADKIKKLTPKERKKLRDNLRYYTGAANNEELFKALTILSPTILSKTTCITPYSKEVFDEYIKNIKLKLNNIYNSLME